MAVCFSLWIHRWRYTSPETESLFVWVCVCVCELKSIGERECVAVVHHSCSVLRRPAQGRVTQSRTERMPMCHSCGHLHGKPRLLPGNASLRSPGPYGTRRICVNHAWPHLVSWIKHTRPLGARHSEVAMTMTMMMLMSDLMTCFLWGYSVLPYCQQITEKKPKANNALMQLWVTNLTPGAARCTTIILLVCSFCPLYAGWSIMPKMCDHLNILLSVLSSQSRPM